MIQTDEQVICVNWPQKILMKTNKQTGEERIEAPMQLKVFKLVNSVHPLDSQRPLLACRVPSRTIKELIPTFGSKLVVEQSCSVFVDFSDDALVIKRLDFSTCETTLLLNVSEELNEQEFYTVARLDYRGNHFLLVLNFDDHSVVCSLNKGKVA